MTAAAVPNSDVADSPRGGPTQLQLAWEKMAGGAPVVVDVLMHIAQHSEYDAVRVNAAVSLLKMVGFGGPEEVHVRRVPSEYDQAAGIGDGKVSSTKIINDRLNKLNAASRVEQMDEDGIIDAVIVSEEQSD